MTVLATYQLAMQARGVPQQKLEVYTSNSYRRVGLAGQYREVVYAVRCGDGHLDIVGTEVLEAMVAAFNAMLEQRQAVGVK